MRRVVTGHNTQGKAIVVSDSEVEPVTLALMPGSEFTTLWGANQTPEFPDDGLPHPAPAYFPPVGGFRFGTFTIPPQSVGQPENLDLILAFTEMEKKLPGLMSCMEKDGQGMHTTDTIDFEYIISGEVWLELDAGKEVLLRAGDTVVQNGTRHAWRNKSSEPCRMVVCMIGARRKAVA
jgi:mannose-6-phosphate isomerase-like protein (cupin superfamily)